MASRSDHLQREIADEGRGPGARPRAWVHRIGRAGLVVVAIGAGVGCRAPGLPAEPPGADAADPAAAIPAYAPSRNVLETSAFEGVRLDEAGHGHHGHHGHGKASDDGQAGDHEPEASEAAPSPNETAETAATPDEARAAAHAEAHR